MIPFAVAALAFLAVASLIVGLWWAAEPGRRVRSRLRTDVVAERGSAAEILRRDAEQDDGGVGAFLSRLAQYERIRALAASAGSDRPPGDIVLLIAACATAGATLGWLRTEGLVWSALVALLAGTLPLGYLLHQRRRRLAQFQLQFPDGLDMLTRAIRAGNALSGAIKLVGEDMPDPVGQEFKRVSEEIRLGMDPGEALFRLQARVPIDDMRFFCTAIRIQRTAGGNLAEILDRLSEVIRERFKILSHARVLSAQHRWAAVCVGLSPLVFAIIFQLIRPGYFDPLLTSPAGPPLIAAGLLFEAIGFFIVWRIAQIKV